MTATARTREHWRFIRHFSGDESFTDDLGEMGFWVGPRTGPQKRSHLDREDYALRRLLVAWRKAGQLRFPFTLYATSNEAPDYVIEDGPDSPHLGVEVTEATSEDWNRRLDAHERAGPDAVWMTSEDGYAGAPEPAVATGIRAAIERKVKAFDAGKYASVGDCDLLVYENSGQGMFLGSNDGVEGRKENKLLQALDVSTELLGRFRRIHLISQEKVFLNLFSNEQAIEDVSNAYEIDFHRWAARQAELVRSGRLEELDRANLAEELDSLGRSERRSLASYLEVLLTHLLKWHFQPDLRSDSWRASIANSWRRARRLLKENPSLKSDQQFSELLAEAYEDARDEAAAQTGLSPKEFPEESPIQLTALDLLDEADAVDCEKLWTSLSDSNGS